MTDSPSHPARTEVDVEALAKAAYETACEVAEYSDDGFNWVWDRMPPEEKAGFLAFTRAALTELARQGFVLPWREDAVILLDRARFDRTHPQIQKHYAAYDRVKAIVDAALAAHPAGAEGGE